MLYEKTLCTDRTCSTNRKQIALFFFYTRRALFFFSAGEKEEGAAKKRPPRAARKKRWPYIEWGAHIALPACKAGKTPRSHSERKSAFVRSTKKAPPRQGQKSVLFL